MNPEPRFKVGDRVEFHNQIDRKWVVIRGTITDAQWLTTDTPTYDNPDGWFYTIDDHEHWRSEDDIIAVVGVLDQLAEEAP